MFPRLLNVDGLAAEPLLFREVALIAQKEAACSLSITYSNSLFYPKSLSYKNLAPADHPKLPTYEKM